MRFQLFCAASLIFVWQAEAEEIVLNIPPVNRSFDVKGQAVKVTAWGAVSGGPQGMLSLALTADLRDLQDNITGLLASQLNRDDRCGERLAVETANISPAAPAAILTARVHVERWGCFQALRREIVKRLVGGNVTVTVKMTPSAGGEGISVASEVQKIDADGSLGEVRRSGSLEAAIKEKISKSIESSLRKALDLKSTLPAEVASAVTLKTARFCTCAEGRLCFSLGGDVRASAAQFHALNLKH